MLEVLKNIERQLENCVQGQVGNLEKVDTHELGEAIDMLKDLSEAIYYQTITQSMEKVDKEEKINNINYYTTDPYRTVERRNGYMYYPTTTHTTSATNSSPSMAYFPESVYEMRDPKEGRAALRRRTYMEGKQMHKDVNSQLHELEAYLQELSSDIAEMVKDASAEQKTILRQKMTTLVDKIK